MYCVSVGASNGLRWVFLSLATIIALVAVAADPADARAWRKKRSAESVIADARYADIIVDVNSGETLHEANAEGLRHPASLTKIMTLYLLFERLEAGKIRLDTPLKVSANAVQQAPSKLGLDEGDTIDVEDAIKALVTKSANDVAVIVAEALAGTEENFAKLMTRKARALAMKYTIYKNASGLPDDDQLTTARDQALLGIAIQERFPRYYRYFSTPQFSYRGHSMRNHNRLLGRVEGVDGIKTGYTRASGFNLVTSVRRGNRQIVAVVLGGKSSSQRDARMRELIETKIASASQRRTKTKLADAEAITESSPKLAAPPPAAKHAAKSEAKSEKKPEPKQDIAAATSTISAPRLHPGSTDPIQPRLVKTFSVKAGATQTASFETIALPPSHATGVSSRVNETADENVASGALPPPPTGAKSGVLGVLTVKSQGAAQPVDMVPAGVAANPDNVSPAVTAFTAMPAPDRAPASAATMRIAAAPPSAAVPTPGQETKPRSGWMIQIGAFDDETEAKQRLTSAQSKVSDLLRKADPFTESVTKGDKTLYRARFAGLDKDSAEAVCKQLKRNDIACFAIRN